MKDQLSDKIMKFVALTVKRQQKTPTMHIKKPKAQKCVLSIESLNLKIINAVWKQLNLKIKQTI